MIAVAFALPQESGSLLNALRLRRRSGRYIFGQLGTVKVVVTHTGVGAAAACERVDALLLEHPPRALIATGFAGGLDPRLQVGNLFLAHNFSAPEWAEKWRSVHPPTSACPDGKLVSVASPAETAAEKRELARNSGAAAVDMETAAIAVACAAAGVPMLAVRVISDDAAADLPVPMGYWFDLARQQPRPAALLGFLARHPSRVMPFVRFVVGLRPARARLASALVEFLKNC